MAYYSDSIYLDKQKELHQLNYENLTDENSKNTDSGLYNKTKKEIKEEDLASNTFLFFKEKDMIKNDIKNVCLYFQNTLNDKTKLNTKFPFEAVIVRISAMLEKYIENPSLLDNLVEIVLNSIIKQLRFFMQKYLDSYMKKKIFLQTPYEFNKLISILLILTKVRGAKNIRKYLGHKASDFEPLVFYLISSTYNNELHAQNKYILMIWLSVILLIPFEFKRLDSEIIRNYYQINYRTEKFIKIELLVIDFCKRSLQGTARLGKAVSGCIAVLFRRPDMKNIEDFKKFLYWGLNSITDYNENNSSMSYCTNIYKCISSMIKNCKREFLVKIHNELFNKVILVHKSLSEKDENSRMRYEKLKMIIRIVDKLLLSHKGRWVYKTIKKNLKDQLKEGEEEKVQMITNTNDFNNEHKEKDKKNLGLEMDSEIHNLEYIALVEKSVDFLLEGIEDEDSNIRYLAAKGLAQLGVKLPENLSDEILLTVLQSYNKYDQYLIHGICLVIGEFCRKGILSPKFLPQVSQILNSSLLFEDIEGMHSSGSIVRDAACFICWSLSRFYEKETMQPFVDELAGNLLITALFDKDGNCRRAAAASFQENVGRQGNFPHGISIISEMDYFSVGVRQNSFLKISPFVAHYKEYTRTFIKHLAQVKLFHFNKEVRLLSAKSLALISLLDVDFVIKEIIPFLIENCRSSKLWTRHGSIIGLGSLILSLSGNSSFMLKKDLENENIFLKSLKINDKLLVTHGEYMEEFIKNFDKLKVQNFIIKIDEGTLKELTLIPNYIIKNGLLKGKGGEISRIGLSYLITGISKAKLYLNEDTIKVYFEFIEEAFRTTIDDIQDATNIALNSFSEVYYNEYIELFNKQVQHYCSRMDKEIIKDIKKSFCLGISSFPAEVLQNNKQMVFEVLKRNCKKDKKIKMNDPEIRKFCVLSLGKIFCKIEKLEKDQKFFLNIVKAYLQTINDYTLDKRGDIGLIIRDQTMDSIFEIMEYFVNNKTKEEISLYLTEKVLINQLGGFLSQILGPNDKIRLKAGFLLQIIVNKFFDKFIDFEGKQNLIEVFNNKTLQRKFQEHQDKYFQNYDISLLDNKKFLSYDKNTNFVYFWNIAKCSYEQVKSLINLKTFNYNTTKGVILSVSSQIQIVSKECQTALQNVLEDDEEGQKLVFDNIYKLMKKKRQDKFYIAGMKTINIMLKLDLAEFEKDELCAELILFIYDSCKKSRAIDKLKISSSLLSTLLANFDIDKKSYFEKYKYIIEFFMFSNYPIVRNEFFQSFYLYLISKGEEIYGEEINDEFSEFISNIDLSEEGIQMYYVFKKRWEEIHSKPF